jgi:predicted short-subunit dehydrogenase-like oxidoreductase (DUF2520 family)
MQDINVIEKQNQQAVEGALTGIIARGNYAVVEKAGLHVINTHECTSLEGAEALNAELNAKGGSVHSSIIAPTA